MPGRTPIAVLSGADTERLAAALRAGADWAFAKPVEWDDLLRCLTCRAAGEIAGTAAADEAVPMTVLVVEDGQAMRGLLRETLERAGHRVIERADGADLPGLVTRKRCDVVVLDEQLPGVRGLELLAVLQTTLPSVPVILATAFGGADTAAEARRQALAVISRSRSAWRRCSTRSRHSRRRPRSSLEDLVLIDRDRPRVGGSFRRLRAARSDQRHQQ